MLLRKISENPNQCWLTNVRCIKPLQSVHLLALCVLPILAIVHSSHSCQSRAWCAEFGAASGSVQLLRRACRCATRRCTQWLWRITITHLGKQ